MKFNIEILEENDIDNGFLDALDNLSPKPSSIIAHNVFNNLQNDYNVQRFIAKTEDSKIGGTMTIIFFQTFHHEGGKIAFLEDVAVAKSYTGMGLGKLLVEYAEEEARRGGCYKIVLNCKKNLASFYEKNGFTESNIQMEKRFKN